MLMRPLIPGIFITVNLKIKLKNYLKKLEIVKAKLSRALGSCTRIDEKIEKMQKIGTM